MIKESHKPIPTPASAFQVTFIETESSKPAKKIKFFEPDLIT